MECSGIFKLSEQRKWSRTAIPFHPRFRQGSFTSELSLNLKENCTYVFLDSLLTDSILADYILPCRCTILGAGHLDRVSAHHRATDDRLSHHQFPRTNTEEQNRGRENRVRDRFSSKPVYRHLLALRVDLPNHFLFRSISFKSTCFSQEGRAWLTKAGNMGLNACGD